jgi:hypothetical protein
VEPTESSGWCSALACGYCTASLRVQPTASHAVPINCAEDSTVSAPQRASPSMHR